MGKSTIDLEVPGAAIDGHKKGLSVLTAIVFISGELAGSGVLALPEALANTGWTGIALIIIAGLIASYSGVCLARCWLMLEERWPEYRGNTRNPFASIGFRANGKWMSYVCSVVMDVTFFGGNVVYILLCSELLESLTHSFIKHITLCDWILILTLLLIPLSWLGSPADFWPLAFGAIGTTILGLILLIVQIIIDAPTFKDKANHDSPTFSNFFLGFGTIVFAFGGAAAFPTFQNDMKDRTKFPIAVVVGFIILIILYLPVSIAGFTVFGSSVSSDILNSVSIGGLRTTITLLFAIHLFLAFLIILNPVAQEFEDLVGIPQYFTYKRCITRTVLMALVCFTALSVPQFGKILSLIGGSSVTLMTFVLPPIFYLSLVSQQNQNKEWPKREITLKVKILLIIIILIGIIAGIASTYSAIRDMADPNGFKSPCYLSLNSFYCSS
ncbi:uncharacterized protein LOC128952915 [Oppia nitens]|uniref:uncharacterized protein LOC128952915 n=1 Tax=Oppia nitens TaxID=1686743 RepID=UPI0023DBFD08|nr:uncharacterized protein LOC128952915 [Oppia nitens]